MWRHNAYLLTNVGVDKELKIKLLERIEIT
jgi:hypothetical protein